MQSVEQPSLPHTPTYSVTQYSEDWVYRYRTGSCDSGGNTRVPRRKYPSQPAQHAPGNSEAVGVKGWESVVHR